MDGNIDLFTLLALIAAVVAFLKLRSVLGRRTGDEETRIGQRGREGNVQRSGGATPVSDKVVALPRRDRDEPAGETAAAVSAAEAEARIKSLAGSDTAVANGLLAILKADPDFDPEHFLRGARQAYEMIVTAFAEGNRRILRDLLAGSVYESFNRAIAEREGRGEQVDQSFVGISKADILEAELDRNQTASIAVRFVSQLITATRDRSGQIIDGDSSRIRDVTDIWTFIRDLSTAHALRNPNWRLEATQSPN
ncbi:MAG TPA: Tim44/TimA family putative adaptor protein [Hyphomicrobiaceae bacterium]|nr:Tim44/TimA family putative adaptor protein [Hyphomicrobiaceae bacterium]